MSHPHSFSADLLNRFDPIGLAELSDQASLLRRYDVKYVIRPDQLDFLLDKWILTHRVLEIGSKRSFHYRSVYYDTPGFALYHAHHAGVARRVKLRVRTYTDSELTFCEVKSRDNHGLTDKRRSPVKDSSNVPGLLIKAQSQHPRYLMSEILRETLQVDYERITLVARSGAERITIDMGLAYQAHGKACSFADRMIIEIKQDRRSPSGHRDLFRGIGVRSGSISKYCLGVLSLYPQVKRNRFKLPIRILDKQLRNHGTAASRG